MTLEGQITNWNWKLVDFLQVELESIIGIPQYCTSSCFSANDSDRFADLLHAFLYFLSNNLGERDLPCFIRRWFSRDINDIFYGGTILESLVCYALGMFKVSISESWFSNSTSLKKLFALYWPECTWFCLFTWNSQQESNTL